METREGFLFVLDLSYVDLGPVPQIGTLWGLQAMSNTFKPGDKVRCIAGAEPTLFVGQTFTVRRVNGYYLDFVEDVPCGWLADRFDLVQAATSSFSSDVAAFVADVEAGRIERGGVPGKYRVFRNDDNNVVVEFFN